MPGRGRVAGRRWRGCCRSPTRTASSQPAPQPVARPRRADRGDDRRRAARPSQRRRRRRFGFALGGAAAAAAAAVLAIVVLRAAAAASPPEQHVEFASLPDGVEIDATLEPHAYGTEIHMYVKRGPLRHPLPRLPARRRRRRGYPPAPSATAGATTRRRCSARRSTSPAPAAIGVHAGDRTFVAPVDAAGATASGQLKPGGRDVTRTRTTYALALLALGAALAIAGCGGGSSNRAAAAAASARCNGGEPRSSTDGSRLRSRRPDAESGGSGPVRSASAAEARHRSWSTPKGFTRLRLPQGQGHELVLLRRLREGLAAAADRRRTAAGKARRPRSSARPSAKTAPRRSPTPATRSTPSSATKSRAKPTATTSTAFGAQWYALQGNGEEAED